MSGTALADRGLASQPETPLELRRERPVAPRERVEVTSAAPPPDARIARPEALREPAPPKFILQVILATTLVAVAPTLVVWWLRASGALTSYPLGAAIGMALSLGAAYVGRVFWQKRPGSNDILFGDLMVWGYALRAYRQRRLRSARAVLGLTSQAQLQMPDGLRPERQVKLLEQLAGALDARDPATLGHSQRVARYAWIIASRMGLPAEQVARVRTAAAVHDIGKVHTPLAILRKPDRLTDEEFEVMKRHAAAGAVMASALHDPAITAMVRHHHERLDASGYPDRLRGQDIPIGARIIAVADTFDAMTSDRPYKRGRAHEQALEVLAADAGTKLDAEAVRAFRNHYSGRRAIALWSTLTTVPSRLAEMLGASAGGLATAAKTAAVAALLGNFAAGTASLAPVASHKRARATRHAALATRSGASATPHADASHTAGAGAGHHAAPSPRRHARHDSSLRAVTGAPATSPTGASGAPPASGTGAQSSPQSGAGGGSTQGSSSGSSEGSSSSSSSSKATSSEEAHGKSEEGHGKSEEAHAKVEEGHGKSEEAHAKAEESHGKAEEAHGKSEEAHGKSEESHGKSEEAHGKVEKAKGKVEEATEKLKETVSKVTETAGGAVQETTGTVGKILSKV